MKRRRAALARLRALEHWAHEALATHPRPYLLRVPLARDMHAVRRMAAGDAALQRRVRVRLMRLRGRWSPPARRGS